MRLPLPKKIVVDDSTPPEIEQTISTLGSILNPFMSDVVGTLNGGVGFDNLELKLVKIDIKTDSNGNMIGKPDVLTGLNRPPLGSLCIDVRNTDNISTIPNIIGLPYIIFIPNNATSVKLHKILNLGINSKYTISVIFF